MRRRTCGLLAPKPRRFPAAPPEPKRRRFSASGLRCGFVSNPLRARRGPGCQQSGGDPGPSEARTLRESPERPPGAPPANWPNGQRIGRSRIVESPHLAPIFGVAAAADLAMFRTDRGGSRAVDPGGGKRPASLPDQHTRHTYQPDLQLSRSERTVAAASLCARLNGLDGDALGAPVRRWINRVVLDTAGRTSPLDLMRMMRAGFRYSALRWFRAGRQNDPLAIAFIRAFPLAIEAEALQVELAPPRCLAPETDTDTPAPEKCDTGAPGAPPQDGADLDLELRADLLDDAEADILAGGIGAD